MFLTSIDKMNNQFEVEFQNNPTSKVQFKFSFCGNHVDKIMIYNYTTYGVFLCSLRMVWLSNFTIVVQGIIYDRNDGMS